MGKIKFNSTILPSEIDYSGYATIPAIYRKIIDAIGVTIRKEGYGVDILAKSGLTWILARCALEVYVRPELYNNIVLKVWKGNDSGLCHVRCVSLMADNKTIGYAITDWCVLDKIYRRPIRIKLDSDIPIDEPPCTSPQRVKPFSPISFNEDKAMYSECDFNGHLNNCYYINRFFNLLPKRIIELTSPIRIDVNFKNEIPYGTEILTAVKEVAENLYNFCMYSNKKLACCASLSLL